MIVVLLVLLLLFVPSPVSNYDAFAETVELEHDIKKGGMPQKWDGYTGIPQKWVSYIGEAHYEDPSITVDIVMGERMFDTYYCYAVIKLANGSQLRTAFSDDNFKDHKVHGFKIAQAKNAVFAINADFCKNKEYPRGYMGYIVREGKEYRDLAQAEKYWTQKDGRTGFYNLDWDLLIIDQYGDLHAILEPRAETVEAWKAEHPDLQIVNTMNFGPALIVDGKTTRETFNNIASNPNTDWIGTYKDTQRIAICQLDKLTYLCVTCEGPEDKNSKGLTMDQFAELLREVESKLDGYSIQVAYNLDGGSSSTFIFKDPAIKGLTKINALTRANPQRQLYDIIYFASAWQE
ncbi:MAG: phosphodiester glycosidase family protein [Clostridia bacterium]|nr:phosphodiester glycosidase family protein [Clostridia bacterium]